MRDRTQDDGLTAAAVGPQISKEQSRLAGFL
jgi:hypothetical protein